MKSCLWVILLLVVGWPQAALAQENLRMSGIEGSVNHRIASAILTVAYERIGITIAIEGFPAKRSLVMSNSGEFDGEVQRIDGISRQYPNLVQVPEAMFYLESSVFVKDPNIHITDWTGLEAYLIGIPRGIKYLGDKTEGMNRIVLKDFEQLFHLLDIGRIDVVVIATNYGKNYLRKHKGLKIRMLAPPILRTPLYHYVHRKHTALIETLGTAIRALREDGTLDRLVREVD